MTNQVPPYTFSLIDTRMMGSFNSTLQLVVTPPIISTGVFVTVIRMLVIMCANCPDLAVVLLKQSECNSVLFL